MFIVKSPVKGYGGISAGVQFKDGVGETDNKNVADWFKSKGYEVTEEEAAKPDKPADPPKAPDPPKQPETDKGGDRKGGKK